ncbi:MAG TPA: tol-pal system-associated acyl-CoA thioesterase [Parvularcula sp.]|nr:tol-pal system-associated acyl-CoA thioesterase [Parvularcula sp.]HBS32644.1 tol-pal system-associated acyl-CoA thioesterase [Parvularcula sp.]HBS35683.1 tol-pal system-associated acyl-CoA thioesterase [Parvularcula sp.]
MPPSFEIAVRVYYEDTDFSGVVYHARHLQFFERGRTEALRACGISHSDLLARAEPLAFAVRRMTVEWLAPARIDDLLTVSTEFLEVRGARMTLAQAIRRGDDRIATAAVEAAAMNLSGRPRRLPPEIIARFGLG